MVRNEVIPLYELSVQLKISTQQNIQDISSKYRLSFDWTKCYLMCRYSAYIQSITQQVFGVSAQKKIRKWFVVKQGICMINFLASTDNYRLEGEQFLYLLQFCAFFVIRFKLKRWSVVKMLKLQQPPCI
jgi:hypothetical protein